MKTTKFDKLIAAIQELQNATGNIERINNGGCGVFAGAAAKRLNRMGFRAYVRVASFGDFGLRLARLVANNAIKSKDDLTDNDIYCDHLIVEAIVGKKRVFFDATNMSETFQRELFLHCRLGHGRMDALSALRVARTRRGWNTWFRRSQIPKLFRQMNEAIAPLM